MEEWRSVDGTNGNYQVSDRGRVRRMTGRVLMPVQGRGGYGRIHVRRHGTMRLYMVHRLVAEAFLGTPPGGHVVNHIDSDRMNNRVENLEYVTPKGNQEHSWNTTQRKPPHRGTKTHFAKLTDADVRKIRALRLKGLSYAAIASSFDTKQANVWHICTGRTWKHLL